MWTEKLTQCMSSVAVCNKYIYVNILGWEWRINVEISQHSTLVACWCAAAAVIGRIPAETIDKIIMGWQLTGIRIPTHVPAGCRTTWPSSKEQNIFAYHKLGTGISNIEEMSWIFGLRYKSFPQNTRYKNWVSLYVIEWIDNKSHTAYCPYSVHFWSIVEEDTSHIK